MQVHKVNASFSSGCRPGTFDVKGFYCEEHERKLNYSPVTLIQVALWFMTHWYTKKMKHVLQQVCTWENDEDRDSCLGKIRRSKRANSSTKAVWAFWDFCDGGGNFLTRLGASSSAIPLQHARHSRRSHGSDNVRHVRHSLSYRPTINTNEKQSHIAYSPFGWMDGWMDDISSTCLLTLSSTRLI